MNAQELTLNIAVNLGRLARWALEKRELRVRQFLQETETFVSSLEASPKAERFIPTFVWFKQEFSVLSQHVTYDEEWAEAMLTWANILTHRYKLA